MILHGVVRKEGPYVLAECLEYPVSTFGTTVGEACSNLEDAILGYLEEISLAAQRGQALRMARRSRPYYWCRMIGWTLLWYVLRRRVGETFSDREACKSIPRVCLVG